MQKQNVTKTYKLVNKLLPYLIYIGLNSLLLLFFYLLIVKVITPLERNDEIRIETVVDSISKRDLIYKAEEFSEEALKSYLVEVNIKFPDIVLAQAKLESGNFTSNLFLEHNNMFGMKIPKQRPTLAVDKGISYASYYHWKSSVIDYAMYQSRYLKQYKTKDDYLNRLGQVYAEDVGYVSKLKKMIE